MHRLPISPQLYYNIKEASAAFISVDGGGSGSSSHILYCCVGCLLPSYYLPHFYIN